MPANPEAPASPARLAMHEGQTIVNKAELREILSRSPDRSDALARATWSPVAW